MPLRLAKRSSATLVAIVVLPLGAQTSVPQSPAVAVSRARALYYTPTDKGLQGFHCDLRFDWKNFLQKASNQPVADDDARLNYAHHSTLGG